MAVEILPPIVVKPVSELSKTHILKNWHINANFDSATITLSWMSPSSAEGCNTRLFGGHGWKTKKSPSKRKRDFRRHQEYLRRRNEGFQDEEVTEVPSKSTTGEQPNPEYLTPPTSPKMERAKTQCVNCRNAGVSVTSREVRATPATTHQPEERSVLPLGESAEQLSRENAASSDTGVDDSVVDSLSAGHLAHDKITQCAFDGPMYVDPMSTSEIIRQLREGVDETQMQGVRAWCDGCAEPLKSWTVCSRCDDTSYCADCFERTDHPKHHSSN